MKSFIQFVQFVFTKYNRIKLKQIKFRISSDDIKKEIYRKSNIFPRMTRIYTDYTDKTDI